MTGETPNASLSLSSFPWEPLSENAVFQEGPGILASDFTDGGIPLVRLSGLGGYEVSLKGCNFVDIEKGSKKWGHFRLKRGDIVVSTSASFGRPAIVGSEAEGAIFYTGLIRFAPRVPELDPGYLKAFLGSDLFLRQAEALASGSVIRHFGPSHLRQMRIPMPPLSHQQAVASILYAFDNKMELNRRMNETLEAITTAIFKDWFVDFGPTRAKMGGRAPYLASDIWSLFPDQLDDAVRPKGWKEKPLDQIADFLNGLALQKYPPKAASFLPVIKIAQLRAGSVTSADRASIDIP